MVPVRVLPSYDPPLDDRRAVGSRQGRALPHL